MKLDIEQEINKQQVASQLMHPLGYRPQDLWDYIDTSLEGFFVKREHNLENFNLLLQILGSKGKTEQIDEILRSMQLFNIKPDAKTFVNIMRAYANKGDIKEVESIFQTAYKKFKSPVLYTSLIDAYSKVRDLENQLKVMKEKQEVGFDLIAPDYTSYLLNLKNLGNLKQAVQEIPDILQKVEHDEMLYTVILTIYAKTYNVEKALKIWDQMQSKQMYFPFAYGEMIMCLAKKPEYAEQSIQIYRQMQSLQLVPDARCFDAVLTAASRLGDLNFALEVLKDMKDFGIKISRIQYSLLLTIYAQATQQPGIQENDINSFVHDSWQLFKEIPPKFIDACILNGVLDIHCKARKINEIESQVMPLFDQYGITPDQYTFRHLIYLNKNIQNDQAAINLYKKLNDKMIVPDFYILNDVLHCALRLNDLELILQLLDRFKSLNLYPAHRYMKQLANTKQLPLRLWQKLQDYQWFNSLEKEKMNQKAWELGEKLGVISPGKGEFKKENSK